MTTAAAGDASSATGPRQLALAFPLHARFRLEDFVFPDRAELPGALRALGEANTKAGRFRSCLLVGPTGSGKTHLLQATCRLHAAVPGSVIYLPLADPALAPDALDGLERCAIVALDDIDAWLQHSERERALLALYQGLQEHGGVLLIAMRSSPLAVVTRYPDLGSRLRGMPVYGLDLLDDAGKSEVLQRLARERGLVLAQSVIDYWLARGGRELGALIGQFEQLDAAALAAQRRLTIPLLKEVLGL